MRQLKISPSITNRDSLSLDRYFAEIGKVRLITPGEEAILTQKIKNGDREAFEQLTKANLRFVVSIAKQYQNAGLTLEDLINEGNMGLLTAAKRFDETKGFKFISYAVWWIRQSIITALAEQSRLVRLPVSQISSLSRINRSAAKLEQQLQRKPTAHELAEDLAIEVEKVNDCMHIDGGHVSIYAPISSGEKNTLLDILENAAEETDKNLMTASMTQEIRLMLNILAEVEKKVIMLFFGLDCYSAHSIEEISEKFNVNQKRIRRIKDKALQRLRQNSNAGLLQCYLC